VPVGTKMNAKYTVKALGRFMKILKQKRLAIKA
jgi:hypothetical protein